MDISVTHQKHSQKQTYKAHYWGMVNCSKHQAAPKFSAAEPAFKHFSKLPLELRQIIWELLLPTKASRIVFVEQQGGYTYAPPRMITNINWEDRNGNIEALDVSVDEKIRM
ncbi:hypothetical protein G7Y89_g15068 [Cudoniella acicularis]|uniref:2EXR domain-containing protein n=1 Tax=Cudoniella acicularis TaxID=354080 RepID=A0A8H4VNE5_9HELO|nr:hypothetical protein G7Y89_g15068 [Cudoniella acicularis]